MQQRYNADTSTVERGTSGVEECIQFTLVTEWQVLHAQVGFVDAFVLRNVMQRQQGALLAGGDALDALDAKISAALGAGCICPPPPEATSMGPVYRVSSFFSRLVGHVEVTYASVAIVVLLLVSATAMGWTETAQLMCNTPTMIIEGGMLLVLMMAHMASHQYMRARVQTLLQRRLAFRAALDHLAAHLPSMLAAGKPLLEEKSVDNCPSSTLDPKTVHGAALS